MKYFIPTVIVVVLLLAGCATTPLVLPENLESFDIRNSCPDEARVVGLDIKAVLDESGESTILAVYWVPRYYSNREPDISLVVGAARYMGNKNDIFYYRCGNLPKGERIGRIILPAATDKFGPGKTVIEMRRRKDSQCLELTELKGMNLR